MWIAFTSLLANFFGSAGTWFAILGVLGVFLGVLLTYLTGWP